MKCHNLKHQYCAITDILFICVIKPRRFRFHVINDDVPVFPRRSSPPGSLGLNTLGTATKEAVVCRRSRRPLWLADEKGGRRLDSLTMCVHLGL